MQGIVLIIKTVSTQGILLANSPNALKLGLSFQLPGAEGACWGSMMSLWHWNLKHTVAHPETPVLYSCRFLRGREPDSANLGGTACPWAGASELTINLWTFNLERYFFIFKGDCIGSALSPPSSSALPWQAVSQMSPLKLSLRQPAWKPLLVKMKAAVSLPQARPEMSHRWPNSTSTGFWESGSDLGSWSYSGSGEDAEDSNWTALGLAFASGLGRFLWSHILNLFFFLLYIHTCSCVLCVCSCVCVHPRAWACNNILGQWLDFGSRL